VLRNFCVLLILIVGALIWTSDGPSTNHISVPPMRPLDPVLLKPVEKPKVPLSQASLLAEDGHIYHTIFSTDCSAFQHWQSYLFFHSAMKVKQPGYVTRIASGCNDEELKNERQWHEENIQSPMSDRFRIHFTPHFSGVKDADGKTVGNYKFFNKPFGLEHWLEFGELMGTTADGKMIHEDDRVILTDPDMLLQRPITGDFSNDREVVLGRRGRINRKLKLEHGQPFAQAYGFGAQWQKLDLGTIAGQDSPAKDVTREEGLVSYHVGPPYLATARDMYSIAKKWAEFVPKVHKEYPHLLAEMFAFCIASAHVKLPHQVIDSLMISNTDVGGEGWPLIDKIPIDDICDFAKNPQHDVYALPSTVHFCQRYTIGEWFFAKRKMKKDFFTCESPLLMLPPADIVKEMDYKHPPGGAKKALSEKLRKREGFMVCRMIAALNDAARFFKKNHCDDGNLDETITLP